MLRITFTGSASVQSLAKYTVNNVAVVDNVYDAGVVPFGTNGAYTVTVGIASTGGAAVDVTSASVVSGPIRIVRTNLAGTTIESGSTLTFAVTLTLTRDEYAEGTISVVTTDAKQPEQIITVRARGAAAPTLTIESGDEVVSLANALVLSPAVAAQTTSRATVTLSNGSGSAVTVTGVSVVAGGADAAH